MVSAVPTRRKLDGAAQERRRRLCRLRSGKGARDLALGGLAKQALCRRGALDRRNAASSGAPILVEYWSSLRPCLVTPSGILATRPLPASPPMRRFRRR